MEHIAEPYTDVQVPTTEINSGVTDQIPVMNAQVVHAICKYTKIETKEGNDKLLRENAELGMKLNEFDNIISSLAEELMK